jgi:hypothetical protein
MAYSANGYPVELASKIGHMRLVQDPFIQRMICAFEALNEIETGLLPEKSGNLDLKIPPPIEQIITIDGGHQPVPNLVRPSRQIGFIQVAVQMIKLETISKLRQNPMADPRDVQIELGKYLHHVHAALPISGIHMPGLTVRNSIREAIHSYLSHYELYPALAFLVFREWSDLPFDLPSMDCLDCGTHIVIPKGSLRFTCPKCASEYKLSDYLGLSDSSAEDRSTAETVSSFRSALEVLSLFSLIRQFYKSEDIMKRTLFLVDGPLLLRAQLSRLVEPIRDFIEQQHNKDRTLYLVGIEKNGELNDFALSYSNSIPDEGDYFIPSTKYIVENIMGASFDLSTYRNRVNYGAKVIIRLGKDHIISANIPTGKYSISPTINDLIGASIIFPALAQLISYRYPNSLIPIVLANNAASISNQPSGGILAQFVNKILHGPN